MSDKPLEQLHDNGQIDAINPGYLLSALVVTPLLENQHVDEMLLHRGQLSVNDDLQFFQGCRFDVLDRFPAALI